jgi:hypothetical protein
VLRYLKAAFLVGVDVPALGRVPVNALLTGAFVILGFGHPAFWLLGLAAEATILPTLAFNKRFQNVVDASARADSDGDTQAKRKALVGNLPADDRKRLADIEKKCEKVLDVYRTSQAEEFIIDTNRDALENLKWIYLKLLIARFHLLTTGTEDTPQSLANKIQALLHDLEHSSDNPAVRQSKSATLDILRRRQVSLQRRQQSIEEVESDLTRVESQVDLLLDNAAMQGKPQTISSDLSLASDLVSGGIFGDAESAVADLDRDYGQAQAHTTLKTPARERA